MAYVNVKDWTTEQVTDWLRGLDSVVHNYTNSFINNMVMGYQLLNLRSDDLDHLGVTVLGHQEIILEAVELLRHFHYEIDKENLQILALRLSCSSNSLLKELELLDDDSPNVQTQIMSDVHNIIKTIKPLVYWLDRSPFVEIKEYINKKTQLFKLGVEIATCAHRDIFSEKPLKTISQICDNLSKISNYIIQDICDPMILQPALLDLATFKKKEQEWGFNILTSNDAIHQIIDIKYGSPAHGISKIEDGDEIVQVNYQTVVGWQQKKVVTLLKESPPDIVLTLKKRPQHTKVYGQIYIKPYRLPSRKRDGQSWFRWKDNLPSPSLLDLPPITISKLSTVTGPSDELSDSCNDSDNSSDCSNNSLQKYVSKPRPTLQRRNTICGGTPTSKRPIGSIPKYFDFLKHHSMATEANINQMFTKDLQFLRDKSASCNTGLDLNIRPSTIIGISSSIKKPHIATFSKDVANPMPLKNFSKVNLLEEKSTQNNYFEDSHSHRSFKKTELCDPSLAEVRINDIIKKFNDSHNSKTQIAPKTAFNSRNVTSNLLDEIIVRHNVENTAVTSNNLNAPSSIHSELIDLKTVHDKLPDLIPDDTIKDFGQLHISYNKDSSNNHTQEKIIFPNSTSSVIQETPFDDKPNNGLSVQISNVKPINITLKVEETTTDDKIKSESFFVETQKIIGEVMMTSTHFTGKNSKSKGSKKLVSIMSKRRNISSTELIPAEIQGLLYQRLRGKHNQNVHWEERWFVLIGNCLYGFKKKGDTRAACLIFLSGFTVAIANEVKSRSYAFKVYHTGTAFYFSADDADTLQCWIELIKVATFLPDQRKTLENSLYSETDESDTEKSNPLAIHNSNNPKKFSSLKKVNSNKKDPPSGVSSSLDRKWFFNKSGYQTKNCIPVPTSQFRSYRKINPNNSSSITTGNFTSHVALFKSNKLGNIQNVSVPNLNLDNMPLDSVECTSIKSDPCKYIYTSNPGLTSDVNKKVNAKSQIKNTSGFFVTLEELMIQQTKERKMNPHNVVVEMANNLKLVKPDVVYGEVPSRSVNKTEECSCRSNESISSCFGKRMSSFKKTNLNLCKNKGNTSTYPKIGQKSKCSLLHAHKTDIFCRSPNPLDKKVTSYEMIHCKETVNDVQFAQNRVLDDRLFENQKKHQILLSHDIVIDKNKLKCDDTNTNSKTKSNHSKSRKHDQINHNDKTAEINFVDYEYFARNLNDSRSFDDSSLASLSSSNSFSKAMQSQHTSDTIKDSSITLRPSIDYPGMEYPPIFEAETYSLADPQSSLSLLRKQGKN